jgi:hypothetical protein
MTRNEALGRLVAMSVEMAMAPPDVGEPIYIVSDTTDARWAKFGVIDISLGTIISHKEWAQTVRTWAESVGTERVAEKETFIAAYGSGCFFAKTCGQHADTYHFICEPSDRDRWPSGFCIALPRTSEVEKLVVELNRTINQTVTQRNVSTTLIQPGSEFKLG